MDISETIADLLTRPGRQPEPALEAVFRRPADPIMITDLQRRIVWVNEGFTERTGYSLEEAFGRSPGALLQCEETDPEAVRRLRGALDAGQRMIIRVLNRSRDGRRYWAHLDIQPFGPVGGPAVGFIGVQLDLSAHTLVADGVRAVLDGSAAGMLVQDENGRIVDCNPAAEQLLGRQRARLMGVTSIDPRWHAVDADGLDLPGELHPAMCTLRSGEPVRDAVMGLMLPDGETRWLSVNTTLLPREHGRPWVVSSFVDVTARRELDRQLQDRCHLTGLPDRTLHAQRLV